MAEACTDRLAIFTTIPELLRSKWTPTAMKPFIYRCVNLLVSSIISHENVSLTALSAGPSLLFVPVYFPTLTHLLSREASRDGADMPSVDKAYHYHYHHHCPSGYIPRICDFHHKRFEETGRRIHDAVVGSGFEAFRDSHDVVLDI
jgi:hypothetical protein